MTGTGLVLRPVRWVDGEVHPEDLAAVDSVYAAHELAHLDSRDTSPASLATYLALPQVLREDTALVERDGAVAGFVFMMRHSHIREIFADVAYVPGERDREREVVDRGVEHALAVAERLVPEPGWTLRTARWSADEVARERFVAHDLAKVRTWFRMRVDCASAAVPDVAPDLPEGVELVVRDDEETRRAIWSVDNEAFLDHWNFAPVPYDEWWEELGVGPTRDPDGWWLLRVDGEPAAFVMLDETRADVGDGYVSVLGVRRPFRGRGLARWLLKAAFVRYRDLGRAGVQLSVDAENETGALRLYEGVGMTVQEVRESWSCPVGANPDDSGDEPSPQ